MIPNVLLFLKKIACIDRAAAKPVDQWKCVVAQNRILLLCIVINTYILLQIVVAKPHYFLSSGRLSRKQTFLRGEDKTKTLSKHTKKNARRLFGVCVWYVWCVLLLSAAASTALNGCTDQTRGVISLSAAKNGIIIMQFLNPLTNCRVQRVSGR